MRSQGQGRRPYYGSIEAPAVSRDELEEGDEVVLRVKWFASDGWKVRPCHFTVRDVHWSGDVALTGRDGHKYRLIGGRPHVECTTDDGEGYHRGNLTGRIKRLG